MGFFSWLLNKNKSQSTTSVPAIKVIKKKDLRSPVDKINADVLPLLYFKNGARKNIDLNSSEPSAINSNLPISQVTPEPTGYFPSYEKLSPAQRNFFLTWLQDLNKVDDLGYPFLLLYCSERHIYENTAVDQAVNLISRLQSTFNNDSFNYYSSVAIAWAARKYENPGYLSKMNLQKLPVVIGVSISLFFNKKIEPDFIMNNASQLGWANKRYIKKYPGLFKKELTNYFIDKYKCPYFPIPEKINQDKVSMTPLTLSNYSLPEEERTFLFPDFLNTEEVGNALRASLMSAHEKVKAYLKHHSNEYRKDKSTNKKRINVATGYPMATENSIKKSVDEFNSNKNYKIDVKELFEIASYDLRFKEDGYYISVQRYINDLSLATGSSAMLHYKRGEWQEAEKDWIRVLNLSPLYTANRLRIMYKKQKRYKDIVTVYKKAIEYSNLPYISLSKDGCKELRSTYEKAKAEYAKYKEKDKSLGVSFNAYPVDLELVKKLKETSQRSLSKEKMF